MVLTAAGDFGVRSNSKHVGGTAYKFIASYPGLSVSGRLGTRLTTNRHKKIISRSIREAWRKKQEP